MNKNDEPKSSRVIYLRLMRRKLQRDLDSMGYPGGRSEGATGRRGGGQTAVIIDAGESTDRKERRPIRRRALQR